MNNQEQKETAQHSNIRAAKAIASAVKTTLGPKGMDKMMLDGNGDTIVTNDGVTILQQLDVSHPGAKMIVEAADTQAAMCYDGTTSMVILAGQLLANSEGLLDKGIHPNIICGGYNQAARWAVEHLDTLSVDTDVKETLHAVARTSVTGKALESSMDHVCNLAVQAIEGVEGDYERIRVMCQSGGHLDESYCFSGVILHKKFMLPNMPTSPNGDVILINTGLSEKKSEENVQVQFSNAKEYQSYRTEVGRDQWAAKAKLVAGYLPKGGAIIVRDSVNETVAAMLSRENISVVQRIPESDMKALSHLLGVDPAHGPEDVTMSIGCSIQQMTIGDMEYVVVETVDSAVTTLVLRGATRQTLDETERGFEDALGVVSMAYKSNSIVPGGGSTYISMAQHLRQRAADVGGREQMAVEAFAEALEVIPATIAENAGHNPLDTVLSLRNEHQQGNTSMGPCVISGGVVSMEATGVWEPLGLTKQAIQSASEVAHGILRIDDIMAKKSIE